MKIFLFKQKINAVILLVIIFLISVFSLWPALEKAKVYAQDGLVMNQDGVSGDWLAKADKAGFSKLGMENLKFILHELETKGLIEQNAIRAKATLSPGGLLSGAQFAETEAGKLKSQNDYYIAQIKIAIKQLEEAKKGNWQRIKEFAKKLYDEAVVRSYKIFIRNGLRNLFSQIAYNSAIYLTSGDVGKKPLFESFQVGDFLANVLDTTLADTLDVLAGSNGFLKFNVCEPGDINLKLAIQYSLFGNFNGRGVHKPRCTFREITEKWDEWLTTTKDSGADFFLGQMKNAFKPTQTDVGIYLKLDSSIRSRLVDEKTQKLLTYANSRIKDVTEPITGFIRTPKEFIDETSRQTLIRNAAISEEIQTGDIIADSLGIFTNTLASRLLDQLFKKGLTSGKRAQTTMAFNWVTDQIKRTQGNQVFANLAEFHPKSVKEDILGSLSQCQNPQNPGPAECVINARLGNAIEEGITVAEALTNGQLRADGLVGFKANGQLTYLNDYPYRSLVIMRIHRIIPVGWELAALYNLKTSKEATLQKIIDCYEDKNHPGDPRWPENCRADMNGNNAADDADYNPYFHLIDPNWVLKKPDSNCLRQGIGTQLISASFECIEDNNPDTKDPNAGNVLIEGPACETNLDNFDQEVLSVVRSSDYCADRQTCLFENANGQCAGEYGYCLKEQDLWRFPEANSCQPQYNTCETLTRTVDNKSFSYLRNTLKPCSMSDAGCLWYSTLQSKANLAGQVTWQWNDDSKVYLNGQAKFCDARDGGCSKLTRMIPGVNTVVNGDFNLPVEDSWRASCGISQATGQGASGSALKMEVEMEAACAVTTVGFIPVDPFYTYVLTGAYKTAVNHRAASVRVDYFTSAGGNGAQVLSEALSPNNSWKHFAFEVNNLNPVARYLKVILTAGGAEGDFYFDDVQLVVNRSPIVSDNLSGFAVDPERYQPDYSNNDSYARTYLKQAPDYLGCELYNEVDRADRYSVAIINDQRYDGEDAEDNCVRAGKNWRQDIGKCAEPGEANCVSDGKYWRTDIGQCVRGGDASCAGYAAVCQQHEVGCQGYKPLNGDPEVSAVAGQGDVCPAECVGYDSYLEMPTYFDLAVDPDAAAQYQNFIPETAQSCKAIEAGCEQFTNLDEVAKGGEGIEYFTKLRQCVSPNNAGIKTYYTWEGSDTTGYQLKKWEFLGSNLEGYGGPCTNIHIDEERCDDKEDNRALCSQEDIDNGNADCRDFFNKNNEHFLTLQSRAIKASSECKPYRRTLTGQIYNADPSEGRSCSPSVNGCREYKGNRGNNIKNVFSETFEKVQNTGDWQNSRGNPSGLERSNEAVYQGGHSLLVKTSDNKVSYPLNGKLTNDKDYLLTFWAKKGRVEAGTKVTPQGDPVQADLLNFELNGVNLSGDWTLQTIGPTRFELPGPTSTMVLWVKDLGDQEVFYLDNIILKEYANSFYAIKNSWNTPSSCDTPNQGAFLGCQAYVDRQQQTQFLKGFANFCSSAAIGCEAFLDTRNSTAYQSSHQYNDQTVVGNDRIVYLVNDPRKQCAPEKQGCQLLGLPILDRQAGEPGQEPVIGYNNTYKINNPDLYSGGQNSILCNPEVLFCSAFKGEVSGQTAYFDPQLASGQGENTVKACYYANGHWFKNGTSDQPCPGAYIAGGVNYIPSFDQPAYDGRVGYDGWAGLCPQNQSTCTEFRNPNQPANDGVKQCDARLSPALQSVCDLNAGGVSVAYNGQNYCQLNINGVDRLVCNLTDGYGGGGKCLYSANDWICTGWEAAYYTQQDIDNHRGEAGVDKWVVGALKPHTGVVENGGPYGVNDMTGNCAVNGQTVCFIPNKDPDSGRRDDRGSCHYNLLCQSDNNYYLRDSIDEEATCTVVDRDAGCLLFHDTSNRTLNISNKASKDGFGPNAGTPGVAFGQTGYQDANKIIKVKKDRQCGEWLECKSGFEQPKASVGGGSEFVCLDLYRCSKKGEGDNVCSKIVSTGVGNQAVYRLSADEATTQIDRIKNLSGYSHPGLNWSGRVVTPGYRSPEQVQQKGQQVPIVNGGFETYLGNDLSKPEGWLNAWPNQNGIANEYGNNSCGAVLDNRAGNIHSGRYSLRIDLKGGAANNTQCVYTSRAGGQAGGYYSINPANYYNLSFWAKSENGSQIGRVGLAWYKLDGAGNPVLCGSNEGDYCGARTNPPIPNMSGPTGAYLMPVVNASDRQWQKYILAVGPGTDRPIPPEADLARIYIYNLKVDDSNHGSIWYDDFAIEPVLELDANKSIAKDCRLYPSEEAPACSYQTSDSRYEGWQGYCLEPDPAYQVDQTDPSNYQNCLQWYPVDSLLGDRLSVFSTQNIGYTDRSPLYYCAQTAGNYNKIRYTDQNPYSALAGGAVGNNYPIPGPAASTEGYKYQSLMRIDQYLGDHNLGTQCPGASNDDNLWICNGAQGGGWLDWEQKCSLPDDYCGRFDGNAVTCPESGNCEIKNYYCRTEKSPGEVGYVDCNNLSEDVCNNHLDENCRWITHSPCLKKVMPACDMKKADECSNPCRITIESDTQGNPGAGTFYYGRTESAAITLDEIGAIKFDLLSYNGFGCGEDQDGFFSDVTDTLNDVEGKFLVYPKDYYTKFDRIFLYAKECGARYHILLAFGKKPGSKVSSLLRAEAKLEDDSGVSGGSGIGGISANIYYYLKDRCSLIAQTVKLEGGVVKEKSWLGRLTSWVTNNFLGFSKKTPEQPYGSFYPPKNSTPEYWSEPGPGGRKDAPLYVYSGGSFDFGPSAGTPWSVPTDHGITNEAPGRICVSSGNQSIIGKECKTSSDCAGGVCGGIGKFCHNQQGISNGNACTGNGDCPNGFTCSYPGTIDDPLAVDKATAVNRLQDLFAKIYGVWQWNNQTGKYQVCNDGNLEDVEGSTSCGLGNFVSDKNTTFDLGNEAQALAGGWVRPSIPYAVAEGEWKVGEAAGTLAMPGGKVQFKFTAQGSTDQLPIEAIWINWNDGNTDYFKGPLGYKPNQNLPYSAYHIYTCQTTEQGDRCVDCGGTGVLNANGSCTYRQPVVVFKDHWGWCSLQNHRGDSYQDENACNALDGKQADIDPANSGADDDGDGDGDAGDRIIITP